MPAALLPMPSASSSSSSSMKPMPHMPSMATVAPLPMSGDELSTLVVDWNMDEPHPSDNALNLQAVVKIRMTTKVTDISKLARKVDTKAYNMEVDGVGIGRPFLDAVLLYTMQSPFYAVLNAELRLLQNTTTAPELSSVIYLAWQGYVRLLLKGLSMCPLFIGEVFRAVPISLDAIVRLYSPGTPIKWNAFSSTSRTMQDAYNVAAIDNDDGSEEIAIFHIVLTTGAADISSVSYFGHEGEVLLKPEMRFTVLSNDSTDHLIKDEQDPPVFVLLLWRL